MAVFFLQLSFGVLLFFIINWIGKHSYSIGYMEISIFAKNEEAPALNFLIRVLSPIVYIVIISAVLYYLKLDRYVHNIYLVNIYYIIFRFIFNVVTNRTMLINWYRQSLYWTSIIIVSYISYDKLIRVKANLLPDLTTVANELWIIIIIFLFQVANNIRTETDFSIKRKERYIKARFKKFRLLYGHQIKQITKNEKLEAIAYAILIYEDFNRPKAIRIIENLKQIFTKRPHTLGVMQVRSNTLISDKDSVTLGTTKIVDAHKKFLLENGNDEEGFDDSYIYSQIISDYNGGSSYNNEVLDLIQFILDNFYKSSNDTVQPPLKLPI